MLAPTPPPQPVTLAATAPPHPRSARTTPATALTTNPQTPGKKKKGFKKCNSLTLPPGMDKLLATIQAPMQEMKTLMADDAGAAAEGEAPPAFHNLSF